MKERKREEEKKRGVKGSIRHKTFKMRIKTKKEQKKKKTKFKIQNGKYIQAAEASEITNTLKS